MEQRNKLFQVYLPRTVQLPISVITSAGQRRLILPCTGASVCQPGELLHSPADSGDFAVRGLTFILCTRSQVQAQNYSDAQNRGSNSDLCKLPDNEENTNIYTART
jgi:hypothetical protein